jgi:hypothetical protein
MFSAKSLIESSEKNFAVVEWFHYRKEKFAGFKKYFKNYKDARAYAYLLAKSDNPSDEITEGSDESRVIREDEITDENGPSLWSRPYDSLIGYGYSDSGDGYSTVFYSVVKSFAGVENSWSWCFSDEPPAGEWSPRY